LIIFCSLISKYTEYDNIFINYTHTHTQHILRLCGICLWKLMINHVINS